MSPSIQNQIPGGHGWLTLRSSSVTFLGTSSSHFSGVCIQQQNVSLWRHECCCNLPCACSLITILWFQWHNLLTRNSTVNF